MGYHLVGIVFVLITVYGKFLFARSGPETCNYNGVCSIVDPTTGAFFCDCAVGYFSLDNCNLPLLWIIVGVGVLFAVLLVVVCVYCHRVRKGKRASSMYVRLLDEAAVNLDVQIQQVRLRS